MKKKTILKTTIKHLFIVLFACLLTPNLLNAQGPTTPEATSFEPVDATDMVNLVTGDLTYVLPLLNVPSPEGGYPITLSYHAGVAMDQESSWVGLGWNINPGAINRSVGGAPDDWKEANISSIVYNDGGEIDFHSFSIGVGWGEGKYSAGLYASYSENKSYGGENSYRFDFGLSASINGISGQIGTNGVGLSYSNSLSMSYKTKKADVNYSLGINHDFNSGSTTISGAANIKMSATGTSVGQNAKSTNSSIGINLVNIFGNNKSSSSNFTSKQVGLALEIGINVKFLNLNYNYRKLRYWLFDKKSYRYVGALYAKNYSNLEQNASLPKFGISFDTYNSSYDNSTIEGELKNSFTHVSYDSYSVSGQGIAGYISPKLFEYGTLKTKTKFLSDGDKKYVVGTKFNNGFNSQIGTNDNIYFYFNNLYESYLEVTANSWGNIPSSVTNITDITPPTSNKLTTTQISGVNYDNYNSTNKRKGSSSFIESYTNLQIKNNPSLIIEGVNFDRNNTNIPENGIGAFKITTPDGKTYHYSIPVYQKEKFSRSSKFDEDIDKIFYEEFQTKPYATHWLLTAITGSDYVDANTDGKIDESDYGYWIEFNYGKWSDGYTWRTPNGTKYRTSHNSKSYSWGVKEIYYLDAIKTRTHTALFVKSDKLDNKSLAKTINEEYYNEARTIDKTFLKDGDLYFHGLGISTPTIPFYQGAQAYTKHKVKVNFQKHEHKTLKLNKILILKNKDLPTTLNTHNTSAPNPSVKSSISIEEGIETRQIAGGAIIHQVPYTSIHNSTWNGEYYNNILDELDISILTPTIENKAIKIIDFNYNYNLASNVPNSSAPNNGKLTLKKVNIKGKKGIGLTPPYTFKYYNENFNYDYNDIDDWGYNKNGAPIWSLNSITQPTGAEIKINYEADDYHKEIAEYSTVFDSNLKFKFSTINNKLRIEVENETSTNPHNINFNNFFQTNTTAEVDIWACLLHEYFEVLAGCKDRIGKIDIPNSSVDVISVSYSKVIFETNLSYTSNNNGGLDWLYNTSSWSYEMDRIQNKARGDCPILEGFCSDRTAYALKYRIKSNKTITEQKGGGIRVKEIDINANGENYITKYYYNKEGFDKNITDTNYRSSGTTSYSPSVYNKDIKYIAEIPSPNILYSNVTVENHLNETTKYHFKTLANYSNTNLNVQYDDIFSVNLIEQIDNQNVSVNGQQENVSKYKYELINNFSLLGKLLKVEKVNSKNQLVEKVENKYKSISDIKQGVIQESFNSYGSVNYSYDGTPIENNYHLNVSSRKTYPSTLESTTVVQGGIEITKHFDKHDFLTGQVLETKTFASDGTAFKTKLIPAHTKYIDMGPKVENASYKNMLMQQAASYTYLLDTLGNESIIDANITTWNNNWAYTAHDGIQSNPNNEAPVWRKHKSFVWDGTLVSDGIYASYIGEDDNFNWGVGASQVSGTKWKQVSEVTRYDHFSAPLESKDINNNFASTKMGDNNSKVIAVANAPYTDMYYSGAEYTINGHSDYFDGEVKSYGTRKLVDTLAHTGKYVVEITPGQHAFEVQVPADISRTGVKEKFKVSVWVKAGQENNVKIKNGATDVSFNTQESVQAGNWVLLHGYVTITSSGATIAITSSNGTVELDDFRLLPLASSMSSYVYNEFDEVTFITGSNGLSTKYIYDSAGRLKETLVEVIDFNNVVGSGGFKSIQKNTYNHKK